ncbi:MAG: thiosulfate sulfurtransferase [Candidatus Marinimicrobia bacterium]|nr:thiosulfate sulfurtransferase [Candidatus Neomarinimicrobiota bacterium]
MNLKNKLILDCRPSAAYNGWPLKGETRGGHIPGAVSFPERWFGEYPAEKCLELLKSKGISPGTPLTITGYEAHEILSTVQYLKQLGFTEFIIHEDRMLSWAAIADQALASLPRYEQLVHPAWLKALLADKTAKNHILAHVSFDNWGDYDEGHIPSAIWLDTLALEDETTWNHRDASELEEELAGHGITADTQVILYGRTADPNMSQDHPGQRAGQLASMRAALLLMYAGVKDVRVLDGGLGAWLKAGGAITRTEYLPVPVSSTGLNIPEQSQLIISTDQAKEYISDPNSELVSVRSWEEFIGKVSGYHYIKKKGRIPGAVFGNCGSDAYHMENYRNSDDTMRGFPEIEQFFNELGITSDKQISFYCGTGWRGSEAFFCAWIMGWEAVSLYDGGWFEWSNDEHNPTETGIPE